MIVANHLSIGMDTSRLRIARSSDGGGSKIASMGRQAADNQSSAAGAAMEWVRRSYNVAGATRQAAQGQARQRVQESVEMLDSAGAETVPSLPEATDPYGFQVTPPPRGAPTGGIPTTYVIAGAAVLGALLLLKR